MEAPFQQEEIDMQGAEIRVLLVEDDEDDYILARDLLSEIPTAKFDLEWVTTYESASQVLDSDRHDICLLDYHLGRHSGLELLQEVKRKACGIPIIVITGLGNYELDREAMRSGAADYLVKDHLTVDLLERSIRYAMNRKRTEEALRESEARYRAIVEDQTELICRFMPDGGITFANEAYCCCLGRNREELHGNDFMSLVPEANRANLETLLASLCQEKPMATCEYHVVRPNGQIQWQQWTLRRISNGRGRLVEYQAVGRDITERKQMEEALRKTAESIKIFAYCISHDLKSPLVGIHGLARLLQRQYLDRLDERGKRYCDQILKASEQVAALIEEINAFIKAKEAPLAVEEVNLQEIIQAIREEFGAQLEGRGIGCFGPEGKAKIRADRLSILRVLRNLVENALKYGGGTLSEIRIGYEETGEAHVLSVSDNGVGIKKEDRERIFGPFQRPLTSKGIPGMGLGLAIVKEIAERHHGAAWVESGAERGTKFCVVIPKNL
jgi:PAS domain S-box-containing protein